MSVDMTPYTSLLLTGVDYETYNLDYVLTLAERFYVKGYKIYLDYRELLPTSPSESSTDSLQISATVSALVESWSGTFSQHADWADPQKQWQPEAWPTTLKPLAARLRKYVSDTMQAFTDAGIDLAIVSLGNEIRNGMLWPLGRVSVDVEPRQARVANFTGLATLYAAARKGVDDAVAAGVTKPEVMIHIDNGYNLTLQERWFSSLLATGKVKRSDWDIFGFSIYPFYGTAATLDNLDTTLNAIATEYKKPIHVVETDWPAICTGPDAAELSEPGIPASPDGQVEWVHAVVDIVKGLPHGLGRGINYWEPAWLNNTGLGSSCQDAILFDTDWSEFPNVTAYSRKSVNMFRDI